MREKENKYTLVAKKKRIVVTEEVYKAYYQLKERERYLDKLAAIHDISLEACEEKGIQVDYLVPRAEESIEDIIIKREMLKKLMLAMKMISEEERLLIHELFFNRKTETALARELGISQSNINRRKTRILSKLKKIL
ncbi:sigma factor-like helix-turn-helix DNA-binding protein [Petroclostridium xylanilyticum]|uniref:sigma factor-like helix-turn-helix DNA-binding protein n=1 Tax=Petroclostridium xylanilyticum TaxID=1792311 RepID=UPI000B97E162|nr:sigma factor-like helix-turn-helix DNA-binding protein [Petroclostridium xylanilyticum]